MSQELRALSLIELRLNQERVPKARDEFFGVWFQNVRAF